MNKKFNLVVQAYDDDGYMYAFTMSIGGRDNLLLHLGNIDNLVSANIISTKKEAERICDGWNLGFKANRRKYVGVDFGGHVITGREEDV